MGVRLESKTTEYTWFRNLNVKSHIERFGSLRVREINGHIEHMGGQSPVSIDILNEINLVIHIGHECKKYKHNKEGNRCILKIIKESIENPENRRYPIHLGRAEDWIVIKGLRDNVSLKSLLHRPANYKHFFWIPKDKYCNAEGLIYRIPTFYTLSNGIRNFEFEEIYLNDGKIKE